MKRIYHISTNLKILVGMSCILLMVTGSLDSQRNQNYFLYTSVLDESAGSPSSANYSMEASSVGQPTPIGVSQSANYNAYGGYLYTLEITCADPPRIVASALGSGNQGCSYSERLEVQSGTGTHPLQWSVIGGELPTGLELNGASGTISGSPTAPGTFDFTVRVTDFCGETDTQAFSITIGPYVNVVGDVNADCAVDIIDVVLQINCCILLTCECTQDMMDRGDCNGPPGNCDGDGAVDVLDSIKIVNLILEIDQCP